MSTKFKFDSDLKAKWVKALRSGRYKQGKNALRKRTEDGKLEYCCIGVLANVCGTHWRADPDALTPGSFVPTNKEVRLNTKSEWDDHTEYIDYSVLPKNLQKKLVDLNDTDNKDFDQIADWIEENL